MSLITALSPLLNAKTAKVALEVSAHPTKDDHMVVVAKPIVGVVPNNASAELQLIVAGLATGIKVVATADTIEAELAAAITEQAPQRSEWAQRAAEITAAADAASTAAKKSAASTKKAGAPTEKTPVPPSNTEPSQGNESDVPAQENAPSVEREDFDLEL